MIYKVVKAFSDLQDDRHVYNAGDTFPREGVDVSEDRLKELSSTSNRLGIPLIKAEKPAEEKPSEEAVPVEEEAMPVEFVEEADDQTDSEPVEAEEETAEVSEPEAEKEKPKKTSKKKRSENAD